MAAARLQLVYAAMLQPTIGLSDRNVGRRMIAAWSICCRMGVERRSNRSRIVVVSVVLLKQSNSVVNHAHGVELVVGVCLYVSAITHKVSP